MKLRQRKKNNIKLLTRKMLKKKVKEKSLAFEAALERIQRLERSLTSKDIKIQTLTHMNSDLIKENMRLNKRPSLSNLFKRKGHASGN